VPATQRYQDRPSNASADRPLSRQTKIWNRLAASRDGDGPQVIPRSHHFPRACPSGSIGEECHGKCHRYHGSRLLATSGAAGDPTPTRWGMRPAARTICTPAPWTMRRKSTPGSGGRKSRRRPPPAPGGPDGLSSSARPTRRWRHGFSAGGASATLLLLLPEGGTPACGLPAILRGHRSSLLLAGRVPRISCGEKCTDQSPRPLGWTGLAREEAPEPRPIHHDRIGASTLLILSTGLL
jgi:hypothetical protein